MTRKEYNILVKKHADDIYRFVLVAGADVEDARDAVQEAYASLWCRRDTVPFEKGKQYLLSAAYNRIKDYWRHNRVVREAMNLTRGVKDGEEEYTMPDEMFDLEEAIAKALESLTHQQQVLLRLKDIEGLSYSEISEITGLNVQQVQVYLFRARVALKRKMNEYGYGES